MEKEMKRILKIIGCFIVIIIIIAIIKNAYENYRCDKIMENIPLGLGYSQEQLEEIAKNTPSDIEGLSRWDKSQLGLIEDDGSDSDNDGLTDKEEIEVYKSDPLKSSTAGDLYIDGYKVEHNMNLFAKYDYTAPIVFPYNECQEFILTPISPTDFYATIQKWPVQDESGYVYQVYRIYQYGGILQIDVNDIIKQNNISSKQLQIQIYDTSTMKLLKTQCDMENNIFTIKPNLDEHSTYYIIIAKKANIFKQQFLKSYFEKELFYYSGEINNSFSRGLIYGSPLFSAATGHIHILYAANKTPNSSVQNLTDISRYVQQIIDRKIDITKGSFLT